MKTCIVFAASAVLAVISIDSAMGMASFLTKIPNGELFEKTLGHKGDSGYTEFGSAYLKAGSWTPELCKATFPGTSMTNGAAFGDPCCTWKVGGKTDFTVNAFTDKPGTETKCAADAPASAAPAPSSAAPAPAPAATTAAPAATTATPAAGTPAPAAGTPAPAAKPSTAPAPAATITPAVKPAAGKTPVVKPAAGKPPAGKPSKCGVKKEAKSLDEDEDSEEIDY